MVDEGIHGRQGVPWKVVGEIHTLELVALSLEAKLKGRGIRSHEKDSDSNQVRGPEAKDGLNEDKVLHLGGALCAMDLEEAGKVNIKTACCSLAPAKQQR